MKLIAQGLNPSFKRVGGIIITVLQEQTMLDVEQSWTVLIAWGLDRTVMFNERAILAASWIPRVHGRELWRFPRDKSVDYASERCLKSGRVTERSWYSTVSLMHGTHTLCEKCRTHKNRLTEPGRSMVFM